MTLNVAMAVILRYSPNQIALGANYVTVVEVKPIREVLVYSTFDRKKTNYTALRRDLDVRFPVCSSFRNQSSIKATLIIFNSP